MGAPPFQETPISETVSTLGFVKHRRVWEASQLGLNLGYQVMWVENDVKTHPPNHHFNRWYQPLMAGFWHCLTHIEEKQHQMGFLGFNP